MNIKPKVLVFAGSVRADSFNKKLALVAAKICEEVGADATYIDLKDYPMPIFDQDEEAASGLPLNATHFKALVEEHDAVVVVSPEYNGSVSALLKNAIDWSSRNGNSWEGKWGSLLAASPGGLGGMRGLVHLRQILSNLGVTVLPNQYALGGAMNAFDENGVLQDERAEKAIKSQLNGLVELLLKLKS